MKLLYAENQALTNKTEPKLQMINNFNYQFNLQHITLHACKDTRVFMKVRKSCNNMADIYK